MFCFHFFKIAFDISFFDILRGCWFSDTNSYIFCVWLYLHPKNKIFKWKRKKLKISPKINQQQQRKKNTTCTHLIFQTLEIHIKLVAIQMEIIILNDQYKTENLEIRINYTNRFFEVFRKMANYWKNNNKKNWNEH